MGKILLVSLVSDQTLPNVQLIKEYKSVKPDYLFVSTQSMERKGVCKWVEKSANITNCPIYKIVVDEYSQCDIEQKLNSIKYDNYERIIVNITGGTKIMSLAVYDYFVNKSNTEIYYLTGRNDCRLNMKSPYEELKLSAHIGIREYLYAYGFDFETTESSGVEFDVTNSIFNHFCNGVFDTYKEELKILREKRKDGLRDCSRVNEFLNAIGYTPKKQNCLDKLEVKYLTGEWFEEYVGERLKKELELGDGDILIGAQIRKEIADKKDLNPIADFGIKDTSEDYTPNEIDVMFMKNGEFHIIECKTSIINIEQKQKKDKKGKLCFDENNNPILIEKPVEILGETIYKSDALKTKFGLFAKSYIFTLTDFKEYIGSDSNKLKKMQGLLNRASLSRIKILDKKLICGSEQLKKIL